MTEADPYFLGYRQAEQDRLGRQAEELAADSNWLFDHVGVAAGWRVIEIGCGPQGCLGLLAGRVGATGRVVGVERSAEQVQRARGFVADCHLTNVEVLHADGRKTGLPGQSFDLATARLVLVNVPQPEGLVQEMVRLVRPGGHGRRMLLLDFVENARARLLDQQLIGETELNELTALLKRHLEDPETLVLSSLFIQAWGRMPERP